MGGAGLEIRVAAVYTCIKSLYNGKTCLRGACIGTACIGYSCMRDACVKNTGAVKCMGICLQLSRILELK